VILLEKEKDLSGGLDQGADALGAECLFDFPAVLNDGYPLQVGKERAVRLPVGERNTVTEGSGLTTMSAFSHFTSNPFIQMIPACLLRQAAYFTMKRIHVQVKGYTVMA
jgi:hypothetical protein